MQEIIRIENGQLVADAIKYIEKTEKALKKAKEKSEQVKQALIEAMEQNNIMKIDNGNIIISYVAPTESERLDTKALKEACPNIYDDFVKFAPVKASVRIKLK